MLTLLYVCTLFSVQPTAIEVTNLIEMREFSHVISNRSDKIFDKYIETLESKFNIGRAAGLTQLKTISFPPCKFTIPLQ